MWAEPDTDLSRKSKFIYLHDIDSPDESVT